MEHANLDDCEFCSWKFKDSKWSLAVDSMDLGDRLPWFDTLALHHDSCSPQEA